METFVEYVIHIIATLTVAGSLLYSAVSHKSPVTRVLFGLASLMVYVLFMHTLVGPEALLVSWILSCIIFYILWGKTAKQEP